MLEAVLHKPGRAALAAAFAATAVVSATGGVLVAARVARWAARPAPEAPRVRSAPEAGQDQAPRVVVPLLKPAIGAQQQTTSGYDVGETMHQMRGAVKA